jgi:hypothetical protein
VGNVHLVCCDWLWVFDILRAKEKKENKMVKGILITSLGLVCFGIGYAHIVGLRLIDLVLPGVSFFLAGALVCLVGIRDS